MLDLSRAHKEDFRNKIENLTDLRARKLLSSIFQEISLKSSELGESEFSELKNFWDENSKNNSLSKEALIEKVKETMQVAYENFGERESLKSDGIFANYIIGHTSFSLNECPKVMSDFCNYLNHVKEKSPEEQDFCFASFPPEQEYLQCLDGSKERIEQLTRSLVASDGQNLFLEAHNYVIEGFTRDLRNNVPSGNEIHVPGYLEYSLGLKEEIIIHPQSQIPAHKLWKMHVEYAPKLRERLLEKVFEIDDILGNISNNYPNSDFNNFTSTDSRCVDVDKDEHAYLYNDIMSSLKLHEIDGQSFVESVDNEDLNSPLKLNQNLLNQSYHALSDLASHYLDSTIGENQNIDETRLEQLRASASDGSFFTNDIASNIHYLLKDNTTSASNNSINPEELILSLEALVILGDGHAGNSPYLFMRIIDMLGKDRPDFVSTSKEVVESISVNHANKFSRIEAKYNEYDLNQNIIYKNDVPAPKLGGLFLCNAPKDFILNYIKDNTKQIISDLHTEFHKDNNLYRKSCDQLINRPDRLEIFQLFKDSMTSYNEQKEAYDNPLQLPYFFFKTCLGSASRINDSESCQFLIDNFNFERRTFLDSNISFHVAQKGDKKLTDTFFSAYEKLFPDAQGDRIFTLLNVNMRLSEDNVRSLADMAASSGNEYFFQKSVESGASISNILSSNPFILFTAAEIGHANIIKFFGQDENINLSQADDDGNTAAHYAAHYKKPSIIKALKECGVSTENLNLKNNFNRTPAEMALAVESRNAIVALANAGIKASDMISSDEKDSTFIHFAAQNNMPDLISPLHDIGVNIEQVNGQGNRAIHLAIYENNASCLAELIKVGADIFASTEDSKHPGELVLDSKNDSLIKAFFKTPENGTGNTYLHKITLQSKDSSELIESGHVELDDYNVENADGKTPLIIALESKMFAADEMVDNLLHLGIKINEPNIKGHTPLYLAASTGCNNAIEKLKMLRVDINAKNKDGDTALHVAVKEKNPFAIKNLLSAGADPLIENANGDNPIYVVASQNNKHILLKFKDHLNTSKTLEERPLYKALLKANVQEGINAVINLIDAGAKVDSEAYLNLSNDIGNDKIIKIITSKSEIHNKENCVNRTETKNLGDKMRKSINANPRTMNISSPPSNNRTATLLPGDDPFVTEEVPTPDADRKRRALQMDDDTPSTSTSNPQIMKSKKIRTDEGR